MQPEGVSTPVQRGEWVFWSALVLFVIAGATGAFFRFATVYGWTGGFVLEHIRHGHSHLMYFGWGTPAMMVLIWRALPESVTRPREHVFRWVVVGTLSAAVLAYPPFLLFGYSPVEIGAVRLPIAVVGASLNMLVWYSFVALYVQSTVSLSRTGALRLLDVAVGALVLATLGAWSLALLPLLGLDAPLLTTVLTHIFLDLFSEGWFVLGALGLVVAFLPETDGVPSTWSIGMLILGLPFTFLLGLPVSSIPFEAEGAGRIGGLLVATGLLAVIVRLGCRLTGRNAWIWGVPLGLLGVKAVGQFLGSVLPGFWLGTIHGLRVLYLHVMLLGFLSLVILAAAHATWKRPTRGELGVFYTAVVVLLLTLLPLTPWIPGGGTAYAGAAWGALAPVLAGAWILGRRALVDER